MGKLRIPELFQDGFKNFISFSPSEREAFIIAIEESPVGLLHDSLATHVATKTGINRDDAKLILHALISLEWVKNSEGITTSNLIEEVIIALRESGKEWLDPHSTMKEELERISRVLSRTVKMQGLTNDRSKLFVDSRIITDIRPLFDDDGSHLTRVTVIHNLKIRYREGDRKKDIYIALDNSDLDSLVKQIERARVKEAAIRASFISESIEFTEVKD